MHPNVPKQYIRVDCIRFARSMYPGDALYVPVNLLYIPCEDYCGMIMDR
ncbi:MAG: hypothetical protein GX328_02830 [Clostridiaceae bacterium]|nr:hypothetical protein [Clostridiaceae bacterium]